MCFMSLLSFKFLWWREEKVAASLSRFRKAELQMNIQHKTAG